MPRLFRERHRRLIFLCGLVPVLGTAALGLFRPGPVVRLENAVYDVMLRSVPARPTSGRVAIVDVDERSLTTLGQWPWRRDLIATLIQRLREIGASVIALDIIFAEADRGAPAVVASREGAARAQTPDEVLAAALRQGGVILGYGLTFDDDRHARTPCVLHPLGLAMVHAREEMDAPAYFQATGVVCNLPLLSQAAGVSGFLNAAPDADGILRRVPLVAALDGRVYPALGLVSVATLSGARHFSLRISSVNDAVLSFDDHQVPLDARSNMLLRYRGPKRAFPYVSAADVLNRSDDARILRDKIVFVGTTALGTREVVATPLDTLFPGVEVQATVADNLLQVDFLNRSTIGRIVEIAAVLFSGAVVAGLGASTGVVGGLLGGVVAAAALWGGLIWLLSASGFVALPLFPTLGVASTMAVVTLATFRFERRRADRAGRETTAARGLMVQTLLSLTEVRDAETGRHSFRTRRYAGLLAEQLSTNPDFRRYLSPERIDLLSSLAPLHDIGKVGIPDHILNKPSALTSEELAEMRKHPELGRQVILQAEQRAGVRDDETLAMAKDIVYTHHERWDGSGYPQGLRGSEIPIAGRIIAVVDVYDAASTRSLYRPSLSHDEVVRMIVGGRGTHFDPAVVDAFINAAPLFRRVSAVGEPPG